MKAWICAALEREVTQRFVAVAYCYWAILITATGVIIVTLISIIFLIFGGLYITRLLLLGYPTL